MLDMHLKGLTLVTSAGEHHRGPEGLQLVQMFIPIVDDIVEQRPNLVVTANPRVKSVDEFGQRELIDVASLRFSGAFKVNRGNGA